MNMKTIAALAGVCLGALVAWPARSADPPGPINPTTPMCLNVAGTTYVPCSSASAAGSPVTFGLPSATSGIAPYVSPSLEACHVMKASQATAIYYSATTGATAGFLMVFNSTTIPGDGPVTPAAEPIQIPANATITRTYSAPQTLQLSTGFTVCFSSTGPLTKTASATAVLEGAWQ